MAKTSSRPTALPLTTSTNSNAGAKLPSATIVDCVFDIATLHYFSDHNLPDNLLPDL
jgi:hypothetical protein